MRTALAGTNGSRLSSAPPGVNPGSARRGPAALNHRWPLVSAAALAAAAALIVLVLPSAARGEAADLDGYRGTFAVAGRILFVHAPREGALAYFEEGRYVGLEPEEPDTFHTGRGERLHFHRDPAGRVASVTLEGPERRRAHGLRVRLYETRALAASSGGVVLAGEALVPRGGRRHPALVVVHGAGPETRRPHLALAQDLARRGVVVAVYDKRGTGASTGGRRAWLRASFDDLARDALAVRAALAALPGVDPSRVGLLGMSQAGWVMPRAAAWDPAVAFVVSVSGPGLSVAETTLHYQRHRLVDLGLGPGARAVGLAAYALLYDVGRLAWRGWLPGRRLVPNDPDASGAAPWAAVRQPVLLLYGGRDRDLPVEASATRIAGVLAAAGHREATVRVFPEADHALRVADGEGWRFVDGYLDLVAAWVRGRRAPPRVWEAAAVASVQATPPRAGRDVAPLALAGLAALGTALTGAVMSRRGTPAPLWLLLAAVAALDAALVGGVAWLAVRLYASGVAAVVAATPLLRALALIFAACAVAFVAAAAVAWRRLAGTTRAWLAAGAACTAAVVPLLVQFGLLEG